jgi:hypothetical protein
MTSKLTNEELTELRAINRSRGGWPGFRIFHLEKLLAAGTLTEVKRFWITPAGIQALREARRNPQ